MPSAAPFGIFYPDDTSPVSPLEALFAAQASSVNTALGSLRGNLPYAVADAAERTSIYPSVPSADTQVFRKDLNYTEISNGSAWTPRGNDTPYAFLSVAGAQATASGFIVIGSTAPLLYTEQRDAVGWHNPASSPERIQPTIAGYYRIQVDASWSANANDARILELQVNGAGIRWGYVNSPHPTVPMGASLQSVNFLNGTTDYYSLRAFQNSGSSLTFNAGIIIEYLSAS